MGITSATVAADNSATGSHSTTLALYDNDVLNLPTVGGLSADSNSLFITTALIADANFDGLVDKTDFDLWHANALTYAFGDSAGDFNHDGAVDGRDFDLWFAHASNAQAIVNGEGLDPTALAALFLPPLTVPEPSSLVLLTPLALLLRRRNRLGR